MCWSNVERKTNGKRGESWKKLVVKMMCHILQSPQ